MISSEGCWWVRSESDPRWNCSGCGVVGGFCLPPDAKRHIEKMKKELGIEPPDDLEYGYMKD